MEIFRPIERYPWPAIGSRVCVLLPLLAALRFFPVWSGGWDAAAVETWIQATFYFTAQCLPYFRWIALRRRASAERTLQQVLALAFPAIASFARGDCARLPVGGEWTLDALFHDKSAILSMAVIVTSMSLIAFGP